MLFVFRIEETTASEVEIEADDFYDARERIEEMYDNCDIILGGDDFVAVKFILQEEISE
ncbi:MAG: hypothetical protein IJM98_08680 [Oscillospiraceae bacterium]|nr:hypothetical protein [Oscillospiraceae bacterium]